MSTYTLRIAATQKDIDSSDDEFNLSSYTISQDFEVHKAEPIRLDSADLWYNVSLGNTVSVLCVRISSDEAVRVKLNAGNEIGSVNDLILKGSVNKIEIKNTSGSIATVMVEVWY